MSKIEKARELYAKHAMKSRLEILDIFQKELGLARGTAASYHDSIKKAVKAKSAGDVGSVKVEIAAKDQTDVKEVKLTKVSRRQPAKETRLLHNFTTEEILEVMDDDTRKDVLEVINRKQDARTMHMVENGE